jgi:hypothetical protein
MGGPSDPCPLLADGPGYLRVPHRSYRSAAAAPCLQSPGNALRPGDCHVERWLRSLSDPRSAHSQGAEAGSHAGHDSSCRARGRLRGREVGFCRPVGGGGRPRARGRRRRQLPLPATGGVARVGLRGHHRRQRPPGDRGARPRRRPQPGHRRLVDARGGRARGVPRDPESPRQPLHLRRPADSTRSGRGRHHRLRRRRGRLHHQAVQHQGASRPGAVGGAHRAAAASAHLPRARSCARRRCTIRSRAS